MADGSGTVYVAIDIVPARAGFGGVDVAIDLISSSGGGISTPADAIEISVDVEGSVLPGWATTAGAVNIAVTVSGTLVRDLTSTGGGIDVGVNVAATGAIGFIGSGSIDVAVTVVASDGLSGSVASGAVYVAVLASGSGYANLTGESGGIVVAVAIAGDGYGTDARHSVSVFSMNLRTAAVAYHDAGWGGVAQHNGNTYVANSTTLRRLVAGDGDDGGCDAVLAKAGIDFNSGKVKQMTEMYLHLESGGSMSVTAMSESAEGTVSVDDDVAYAHHCKVDLPRGIKGRNLGFNVQNVDGCWFTLLGIEMMIAASATRRTRQARG